MEKERLKEICSVLESYNRQYCLADKKGKDRIEKFVRMFVETLPGELYLALNENAGSGLFRYGRFESDMNRCLNLLKNIN